MKRLVVALGALFALLAVASPVEGSHSLPSGCAFFPIPHTYEAKEDRGPYLIGAELAGFNMIAPSHSYFGTPRVEEGSRTERRNARFPYIPRRILKAIGVIESNIAQADHSVYWGATGPVKVSFDCGHGIMQVTSGMVDPADNGWPSRNQALVNTHFLYNIARGAAILVDKWNAAPELRPVVGESDPKVVETWYYALWGYNGFASVNSPLYPGYPAYPRTPYSCGPAGDGYGHNRGNYPYQELVYGCMARPPRVNGRLLWNPLNASLPNLNNAAVRNAIASFPNSSRMDYVTPRPLHRDVLTRPSGLIRSALIGAPVLQVSRTSVSANSNTITISNPGSGILAWRARPQQAWIRVNKQAGVALGQSVPCTPGYPCARSTTLNISVNTATAPANGEGQVVIENLITGGTRTITVTRGTSATGSGVAPKTIQP